MEKFYSPAEEGSPDPLTVTVSSSVNLQEMLDFFLEHKICFESNAILRNVTAAGIVSTGVHVSIADIHVVFKNNFKVWHDYFPLVSVPALALCQMLIVIGQLVQLIADFGQHVLICTSIVHVLVLTAHTALVTQLSFFMLHTGGWLGPENGL